jgi:hypothetical protein
MTSSSYEYHRGILIPKFKEIERDTGNVVSKVSGHFRIEARAPHRYKGPRVLADFKNLILDQGLRRIASRQVSLGAIQLGSGTTAPAASDTTLATYITGFSTLGPANIVASQNLTSPSYGQVVANYRAAPGVATGTFSEIGIGWATSGANLLSRALILDSGGLPVPITVLADEYLDVFWTGRIYWPETDVTGTTTISGSSYNWTLRACTVGSSADDAYRRFLSGLWPRLSGSIGALSYPASSTLGNIFNPPTGGSNGAAASVSDSYVSGNTFTTSTMTFGLSNNPAGGIGAVTNTYYDNVYTGMGSQQSFSPALPKTSSNILTLVQTETIARYP